VQARIVSTGAGDESTQRRRERRNGDRQSWDNARRR
jgi:hypothetical protein